jgi:hypothetical protein
MKNDEQAGETKQLLKNTKLRYAKTEEYPLITSNFSKYLKITNISILIYILFSTIFYFIVHFYGKRIIKSKTVRVEYENELYQNLFVNFYFTLSVILGFMAINRKSLYYFSFYYMTFILYSTLFIISYYSNFYSDYLVNKKFVWFSLFELVNMVFISIYLLYHFVFIIHQNKKQIENSEVTASNIIHEINLRTDMFKISFNYYVIRWKLHKLIPSLLFKKDSFYFTQLSKANAKKNDESLQVGQVSRTLDSDSTFHKTRENYSSLD